MSQQSFANNPGGVIVQKPKWDVYTTMILLSFFAICVAITLLCLEMRRYNFDINANEGKLQRASQAAPVVRDVALATAPSSWANS